MNCASKAPELNVFSDFLFKSYRYKMEVNHFITDFTPIRPGFQAKYRRKTFFLSSILFFTDKVIPLPAQKERPSDIQQNQAILR